MSQHSSKSKRLVDRRSYSLISARARRRALALTACLPSLGIIASAAAQLGVPISPPAPLNSTASTDNGNDMGARLVHDGAARWIAVWHSTYNLNGTIGTDLDLFRAISDDGGQTWTSVATLNTTAVGDSNIDRNAWLALGSQGVWLAAWESTNSMGGTTGSDHDILIARSNDNGVTWSPPAVLNSNATIDIGHDHEPCLVTSGDGVWLCAWRSLDSLVGTIGNDADVLVSRSVDGGQTWTAPTPLNTNAATDSGQDIVPRLATDTTGTWIATWHSNDTLGGTVGSDYDILYSRSIDNGVTWTAPAPLHANAAVDSRDDSDARIAHDNLGHWIAVWSSADTLGNTIGLDRDILVSRSVDGGQSWSPPQPLNANAASDTGDDTQPAIGFDGHGRWIVTWTSTENLGGIGTDLDLLIAISQDGGVTWSAPVPANVNAAVDAGADQFASLACDNNGAWLLAWESGETLGGTIGTDWDILVARFAMPDCNANTLPDITEPDCNSNSVPDDCDIAGGTSADANGNGVPDECEPPPPACPADVAPSGGDGFVNVNDLLAVINGWGPCPSPPASCPDIAPPGGDRQVNVNDLLAVINAWGACP